MGCINIAHCQTKVYGKIIDAETKETLPFINIVFDKNDMGIASDINGNYSISTSNHVDSIRAFYLGYETKVVAIKHNTIQEINFVLSPISSYSFKPIQSFNKLTPYYYFNINILFKR